MKRTLKIKDLNPQRRTAIVGKLKTQWAALSDDNRKSAETWYETAHAHVLKMGDLYSYSPESIFGCVAWLSPGVRWSTNLQDAETLARDINGTATTYPSNIVKAVDSLTSDGPLFGPYASKVRSFYSNLREPLTSREVTIDRWILRILGLPENIKPKQYAWIAECFRLAADSLGVRPHVLQAGVWLAARERVPGVASTDPTLEEVPF